MLGAAIGPGADAQFVELDVLFERGLAGIFLERLRRNDGSAAALDQRFDSYLHDTQLTAGARTTLVVGAFLIDAAGSYSHRIQRDFIADDNNVRFTLSASWWP